MWRRRAVEGVREERPALGGLICDGGSAVGVGRSPLDVAGLFECRNLLPAAWRVIPARRASAEMIVPLMSSRDRLADVPDSADVHDTSSRKRHRYIEA